MQRLRLIIAVGIFFVSNAGFSQIFLERTGRWVVGGGLGFTEDPGMVRSQLWVNYYITDEISVGPLFEYDFQDNDYILGLAGMVKYSAVLKENRVVRPYGQLGIGFIEFNHDELFDGERKTYYLFPVGGGFEFKLAEQVSLDASILFDISRETFLGLALGVNYIF